MGRSTQEKLKEEKQSEDALQAGSTGESFVRKRAWALGRHGFRTHGDFCTYDASMHTYEPTGAYQQRIRSSFEVIRSTPTLHLGSLGQAGAQVLWPLLRCRQGGFDCFAAAALSATFSDWCCQKSVYS